MWLKKATFGLELPNIGKQDFNTINFKNFVNFEAKDDKDKRLSFTFSRDVVQIISDFVTNKKLPSK